VSGKVEGQPNGDTIPAEQANPSDDTVAGAGSRQNDQIVQKIEEVLSGALDTELQCKSDKNTVNNSTQSTKRSSTAEVEDEIPRKKSKKNKKHKSKKKKKKKKKRKKEKKHKKQPKESKLKMSQATLQLENTNASEISESESNMRGLEATALPLQKEDMKGPAGVLRPTAVVESETLGATSVSLQMEGAKASEEPVKSVVAHTRMEPVTEPEALAEIMHLKTTAEREPKHVETVAEPLVTSKIKSFIVSQSEDMIEYKAVKAVEYSKTTPGPFQEQIVGDSAVL
ncbi:SON protein, partial [Chauna torquata]|nr:SON protein [Chauna torquata]